MFKFAVGFLAFVGGSSAYEIGCLYPAKMPLDPHEARNAFSGGNLADGLETPMVVHQDTFVHVCEMNCIAIHDSSSLNMLTLERPFVVAPDEYHNTWSRLMCIFQCYGMIPPQTDKLQNLFIDWEFPFLQLNQDVADCNLNPGCLEDVIIQNDYDPRIIGQTVYLELEESLRTDGWNYFGDMKYDHATNSKVDCVEDCQPYASTVGYFPRNNPERIKENEKYVYEGNDRHWQPIQETDGYGNFKRQEHVVPHIGFQVQPFVIEQFKMAPDPEYNYTLETELVIERLADLVADETKKAKVIFYDQKLLVRGFLQLNMEKYRDKVDMDGNDIGLKFEDHMVYLTGLGAVEHDAVVQCWREKVRHDLVRPTTLIQRWGTDPIVTYAGNLSVTEPIEIQAHDFQAFIRVMPHAEYPSGSASLCNSYAEFTQYFTKNYFGEDFGDSFDLNNITLPKLSFDINSLAQMANDCGESRLWGGMHFTASVQAGKDLVSGNGKLAYEYAQKIKNGSDWGNTYEPGDQLPPCTGGR